MARAMPTSSCRWRSAAGPAPRAAALLPIFILGLLGLLGLVWAAVVVVQLPTSRIGVQSIVPVDRPTGREAKGRIDWPFDGVATVARGAFFEDKLLGVWLRALRTRAQYHGPVFVGCEPCDAALRPGQHAPVTHCSRPTGSRVDRLFDQKISVRVGAVARTTCSVQNTSLAL